MYLIGLFFRSCKFQDEINLSGKDNNGTLSTSWKVWMLFIHVAVWYSSLSIFWNMLHAWAKNSQRLPNISWRILSSKQRVHRSPLPNEHPVSVKGPITITSPAPLDRASLFYINRRDWGGVQRLNEAQWTSWNAVSTGFVKSLEFLKQSSNLPSNKYFQDLKKSLENGDKVWKNDKKSLWVFCPLLLFQHIIKKSFVHSSIDHRFDNLESGKRNHCCGKTSGKSLEYWIQKSVWTLYQYKQGWQGQRHPLIT